MSKQERLPLKTILKNLKDIADEVRTDPSSCENIKQELKGCGYDCEELSEQVIKVLAVAVNEAIRTKVNLSGENKEAVKAELHQLLDDDKHVSSVGHFKDTLSNGLASMSSPLDMAKHLKTSAPQWLVKSIIQHQFDIRWDTPNGDPADYKYYQFCDNVNTTKLFKYKPRQAHVKAMLYKECRQRNVNDLRRITKEHLCPTVYIRTIDEGWVSWQADKEGTFNDVKINTDVENNTGLSPLSWINSSILTFITKNADEQSRGDKNLKESLKKPTLYWAVLDDGDFEGIGQTQVYVGRATNGIRGRWTQDGDNHCEMMKKCLDNVCAMTTYDSLRLEDISLVDARLTLAKVRRERTALFVIKTFGDDVEKAKVAVEKARMRLDEAKKSSSEASSSEASSSSSEASSNEASSNEASSNEASSGEEPSSEESEEVKERQDELDEANAVLNALQNDPKISKLDATVLLTEAEKWHRKGKRVDSRQNNIIPYKDYKFTWKPTDGYGMNYN